MRPERFLLPHVASTLKTSIFTIFTFQNLKLPSTNGPQQTPGYGSLRRIQDTRKEENCWTQPPGGGFYPVIFCKPTKPPTGVSPYRIAPRGQHLCPGQRHILEQFEGEGGEGRFELPQSGEVQAAGWWQFQGHRETGIYGLVNW